MNSLALISPLKKVWTVKWSLCPPTTLSEIKKGRNLAHPSFPSVSSTRVASSKRSRKTQVCFLCLSSRWCCCCCYHLFVSIAFHPLPPSPSHVQLFFGCHLASRTWIIIYECHCRVDLHTITVGFCASSASYSFHRHFEIIFFSSLLNALLAKTLHCNN